MNKKNLLTLYFNECRTRSVFIVWSFGITLVFLNKYSFESLFFLLAPFSRTFIFTDTTELFSLTLFFHLFTAFLFTIPLALYHGFAFINGALYYSQRNYFFVVFLGFLFLYFVFCILFLFLYHGIFYFFLEKKIETSLLSISPQIRVVSIGWQLFYCFILPVPLPVLVYFLIKKHIYLSRFPSWIGILLGIACILPPDPLLQLYVSFWFLLFFEGTQWLVCIWKASRYKGGIGRGHP